MGSPSLPLQMALYFNVWYSVSWILLNIVTLILKYDFMSSLFQTIATVVFTTSAVIEILRLYLGYTGHILERIPDLVGCWLLTLLQIVFILFLTFYEQLQALPLETVGNGLLLAFLLVEFLGVTIVTRTFSGKQATRFHVTRVLDFTDSVRFLNLH